MGNRSSTWKAWGGAATALAAGLAIGIAWMSASQPQTPPRRPGPMNTIAGWVLDSSGAPARSTWLRFVTTGSGTPDPFAVVHWDGTFRIESAWDFDYDVYIPISGRDGRPALGAHLGRCHGGELDVTFRLPR